MTPRPGPTAIPHIPRPQALDTGLCVGHPHPEWWHPGHGKSHLYAYARPVCMGCGVRAVCLEFALAVEPTSRVLRHGMWGGTTPPERHRIARARGLVGNQPFPTRRTA